MSLTPHGKIKALSLDEKIQYCRFNREGKCTHFKEPLKRDNCIDCIGGLDVWEPDLLFVARSCGSITCYLCDKEIGDLFPFDWFMRKDLTFYSEKIIKDMLIYIEILRSEEVFPKKETQDRFYLRTERGFHIIPEELK